MCTATAGGLDTDGIDLDNQALIQGRVLRSGTPVHGAYVRLLDSTGEFTAEVPTSATGHFRFFAANGRWTLRTLVPGATTDRAVAATRGAVSEVDVEVAA